MGVGIRSHLTLSIVPSPFATTSTFSARTVSIASVSSATSEAIALRLRTLSLRNDESNMEIDTVATPTNHRCDHTEPSPLIDYTGQRGYEEVPGDVDVYIATEPSLWYKTSNEQLWVIFWHVGAKATGVRVVRRGGKPFCGHCLDQREGSQKGATVTVMDSSEPLAGSEDLKIMHMASWTLGQLSLQQRLALMRIATETSCVELDARNRSVAGASLLSHREWMEAVMQEAIEQGVVVHEKVTKAFSELLKSEEW